MTAKPYRDSRGTPTELLHVWVTWLFPCLQSCSWRSSHADPNNANHVLTSFWEKDLKRGILLCTSPDSYRTPSALRWISLSTPPSHSVATWHRCDHLSASTLHQTFCSHLSLCSSLLLCFSSLCISFVSFSSLFYVHLSLILLLCLVWYHLVSTFDCRTDKLLSIVVTIGISSLHCSSSSLVQKSSLTSYSLLLWLPEVISCFSVQVLVIPRLTT